MSAIAVEDLSPVELGAGAPRRNHLRAVRPGERAADRSGPVTRDRCRRSRLVLTRRGRLAVTLSVVTLVALAAVATLGMFPAGAADGQTVVVQPGQTLSHLAVTHLPELPMSQGIVQIQLANGMNSLDVQAGTELVIPGN